MWLYCSLGKTVQDFAGANTEIGHFLLLLVFLTCEPPWRKWYWLLTSWVRWLSVSRADWNCSRLNCCRMFHVLWHAGIESQIDCPISLYAYSTGKHLLQAGVALIKPHWLTGHKAPIYLITYEQATFFEFPVWKLTISGACHYAFMY